MIPLAMKKLDLSQSDGTVSQFKSMISKKAQEHSGQQLDRESKTDVVEIDEIHHTVSSSSALHVSTSSSSIGSAMKYFGLASVPSKNDGKNAAFDAFMDLNKGQHRQSRIVEIKTKSPWPLEEKDAAAHSAALGCIADKKYDRFVQIVKNNPSILLYKTKKTNSKIKGCNGGTILHVLVSQKPKLKKKHIGPRNSYTQRALNVAAPNEIHVHPSVPQSVLKFVIKMAPQALEITDDSGRLPIHCACLSLGTHLDEIFELYGKSAALQFKVMEIDTVQLILRYNINCAAVADNKGNLPIHYTATMVPDYITTSNTTFLKGKKYGIPSAEATMEKLLAAHPRGIAVENNNGMLPIHVTASMGKEINIKCLKLLLLHHQSEGDAPIQRDDDGDPPLFVAIKSGASLEAIRCFAESKEGGSSRLFIQRDSGNNNALHVALSHSKYPEVDLISKILDIAPFTASSPDSHGIMPIKRATQLRLGIELIRKMLARDMPIEMGVDRNESMTSFGYKKNKGAEQQNHQTGAGLARHVVGRSHHHSWWFILVECKDFYIDMVHTLLCEEATHFQIVSLARQVGPDGKLVVINCVSDRCRLMFHSLLRFYDRYEVLLSTNESKVRCDDIVDGVQTFLALDHGPMPSTYDAKDSKTAHSSNAVKVVHDRHNDSCVEVSLLSKEKSKVLLRSYLYEGAFYAELKVRETYSFNPLYFEEIYNHHRDENFTHLTLSKGDRLCCITFERPDHSLADVYASVSGGTRSKKWIEKCWVVLKQVASALQDLHGQGLIHGHLEPSSICKYGNTWKLAKLGTVVPVSTPMRGTFRSCAPPESIFVSKLKASKSAQGTGNTATLSNNSTRVKFSPRVLLDSKEKKATEGEKRDDAPTSFFSFSSFADKKASSAVPKVEARGLEDTRGLEDNTTLTFNPGRVNASVAWDMWSFGLIMAQLLLGR